MKKRILCLCLALAMTLSCLSGLSLAATVIATVQTPGSATVNATSVSQMVNAVSSTGESVITLQQDITSGSKISAKYTCTLDLNGHTIHTTAGNSWDVATTAAGTKNAVSVVKNGTLICDAQQGITVRAGGMIVDGVTIYSYGYGICLNTTSTAYNSTNRITGSIIISKAGAALQFNNQSAVQTGIRCTLEDSTLINAKPASTAMASIVGSYGQNSGSAVLGENVHLYHYPPYYSGDIVWAGSGVSMDGLYARGDHELTELTFPQLGLTLTGLDGWHSYSQPEDTDIEKLQQAVVETALAYYREGAMVQYDWAAMTWQQRFIYGVSRMNTGAAPEEAACDFTVNTNCSDWMTDIYLNAFNYAPTGSSRYHQVSYYIKNKRATDTDVIYYYRTTSGTTPPASRTAELNAMREQLQPGDIIAVMIPEGGHNLMYLGDYLGNGTEYLIHSTGGGSNIHTGKDTLHTNGTIRRDKVDILFDEDSTSLFCLHRKEAYQIAIVRPLNVLGEEDLTSSALSRLENPLLDIDRTSEIPLYSSVEPEQEFTVTTKVTNHGSSPITGLTVSDPLPQGAVIVPDSAGSGGVISDNGVTWTVDLAAGQSKNLTYRVMVTAGAGETVILPKGTVDNIPTRRLHCTVMGSAWAANDTALAAVKDVSSFTARDTAFANEFYKSVLGIDLNLPKTMNEILSAMFTTRFIEKLTRYEDNNTSTPVAGGYMLIPKDRDQLSAEYQRLYDMILQDHLAGRSVYLGARVETGVPENRVFTYFESNYLPGDIFLCTANKSFLTVENANDVVVYIYLGSGKVAALENQTVSIADFNDTVACNLRLNVMLCLRPALLKDLSADGAALLSNGGVSTFHATVQEAAAAVNAEGTATVTLLQDANESITAPYSFILDLNGKTLTSGDTAVTVKAAGSKNAVTLVKNGTILAGGTGVLAEEGGLQIRGTEIRAAGPAAAVLGTDSSSSVRSSTLISTQGPALRFENAAASQTDAAFTVESSVLASVKAGGTPLIATQNDGGTVVWGSGNVLYSYDTGHHSDYVVKEVGALTKDAITQTFQNWQGLTCRRSGDTELPDPSVPADKAYAAVYQHGDTAILCSTLEQAVSLITSDGLSTITLLKDHVAEGQVALTAKWSFTLDLNGFSLSSPDHNGVYIVSPGTVNSVTTVKNGSISGYPIGLRVDGGGIQVQDAFLRGRNGAALALYTTSAQWNSDNLVERSVLLSDIYYAVSYNSADANQSAVSITLRESDFISARSGTILGTRNTAKSGTMVIGKGANFYRLDTSSGKSGTVYSSSDIAVTGESIVKQAGTKSISIPELDFTKSGLYHWKSADAPQITVSVQSAQGGTITAPAAVRPGETVTVSAAAGEGYVFCHLLVNGTPTDGTTFTAPQSGSVTLQGVFRKADARITLYNGFSVTTLLETAVTGVTADGRAAVTLLENCSGSLTAPYSFTLDLGGKTLTSDGTAVTVTHAGALNPVTLVKHGTIHADKTALLVEDGALQLQDTTLLARDDTVVYTAESRSNDSKNSIKNSTVTSVNGAALAMNGTISAENTRFIAAASPVTAEADSTLKSGTGTEIYTQADTALGGKAASSAVLLRRPGTCSFEEAEIGTALTGLTRFTLAGEYTVSFGKVPEADLVWAAAYDGENRMVWMGAAAVTDGTAAVTLPANADESAVEVRLFLLEKDTFHPLQLPISAASAAPAQ